MTLEEDRIEILGVVIYLQEVLIILTEVIMLVFLIKNS